PDIDKLTPAKNELTRFLLKKGIKAKVFKDIIEIMEGGKRYFLQLLDVVEIESEDDETSDVMGMTAKIAQGQSENAPKARNLIKRLQSVEPPIIAKADRLVRDIERKAYENPINY
ncbi:MAG: hypothetical protein ACO3UU_08325, partial [Minisyncoccia bacterium]